MDLCPRGRVFLVPSRKRVKSCGMEVKFAVAITVGEVELGPPWSSRSRSRSLSLDKASGEAGSLEAPPPPPSSLLAFP